MRNIITLVVILAIVLVGGWLIYANKETEMTFPENTEVVETETPEEFCEKYGCKGYDI